MLVQALVTPIFMTPYSSFIFPAISATSRMMAFSYTIKIWSQKYPYFDDKITRSKSERLLSIY